MRVFELPTDVNVIATEAVEGFYINQFNVINRLLTRLSGQSLTLQECSVNLFLDYLLMSVQSPLN